MDLLLLVDTAPPPRSRSIENTVEDDVLGNVKADSSTSLVLSFDRCLRIEIRVDVVVLG